MGHFRAHSAKDSTSTAKTGCGANAASFDDPRDYFRKNFFELVDCAVAAINSRFNTPWLDLACTVERLLMEGAALLKQVTEHYEDDMNPGRLERQLLFLSDMRETEKLQATR